MSRGTHTIINYANLKHNFQVLSQLAPNKLVLVVKADAYGHGLKEIVQALDNADCFAVATIDEALAIRKLRPTIRVLLLEGYLNKDELQIAIDNNFDSVIHQRQQLEMLDGIDCAEVINIWLKYDSGMNRLGFSDVEFSNAIVNLEKHKQVNELFLMSHFSSANLKQSSSTEQQRQKFLKLVNKQQLSLSNSSALLNNNYLVNEWCRVGLSLFGVSPIEGTIAAEYNLKPVMTLKTNIIAIKPVQTGETIGYGETYTAKSDMKIAIIGIGYGDGYPWSLSENAYVKIKNKKAIIVGRVSMDMMAIDVSDIKGVAIGDSALIWGEDESGKLPLETVALNASTIPYVLLCQITSRVDYNYV